MYEYEPNEVFLEKAAEKCKHGDRVLLRRGGTLYVLRVAEYDPELHGESEMAEKMLEEAR